MDKYDLVFDVIEHPENYTSEQLAELLREPETREIYNLLCKTDSVIKACKEPDINSEWENFSDKYAVRPRSIFSWLGSRAASIAAIVGTSIVAVAAGIAVTVSVIAHNPQPIAEEVTASSSAMSLPADTLTAGNDTVSVSRNSVMFENEPLEKIMKEVAEAYGVEVKFNNKEAASLHLYYRLDTSLPLNEVVEQLNTFEQINISQNGNILNID